MARRTRRPSASSVMIVTNWSRTPGAHGTSGTARYRVIISVSLTTSARPVTTTDQPEQFAASSSSASTRRSHNQSRGSPLTGVDLRSTLQNPQVRPGSSTCYVDSGGRALTCAAPVKWRPPNQSFGRRWRPGCRAQHDEPVYQHEVHRSHGRERVHGEDQPPDRHAREQPKALGAVHPRELTRCRRVAAVTHCASVVQARAVRPGPKVPNQTFAAGPRQRPVIHIQGHKGRPVPVHRKVPVRHKPRSARRNTNPNVQRASDLVPGNTLNK
jgi:hypothetical protein